MAYTPELSQQYSCTLRRIAWALDEPMTIAIKMVLDHTVKSIESAKVCEKCRDKTRCNECAFYKKT
jgi:hypothetical protein